MLSHQSSQSDTGRAVGTGVPVEYSSEVLRLSWRNYRVSHPTQIVHLPVSSPLARNLRH